MNQRFTSTEQTDQDLRSMLSVELVEVALRYDDPQPIHRLLERPFCEGRSFPAVVDQLKEGFVRKGICSYEDAEFASHLTVERFVSFPDSREGNHIDCRNQYRSLLESHREEMARRGVNSRVESEACFGLLFRRSIRRHFQFALKEAYRANDFTRDRYEWRDGGSSFWLTKPSDLDSKRFLGWLKSEFPGGIPETEEGRREVQDRVWERFSRPSYVDLGSESMPVDPVREIWDRIDGLEQRLVRCVVEEKMLNFDQLPSRLRNLGRGVLQALIKRVFSDLLVGCFDSSRISRDFDISPSTFSRIAGPNWWKSVGTQRKVMVPDLWENVITVLSKYDEFEDAVAISGIQERLKRL